MDVSVCQIISKDVQNHIFRHNLIFRHTCMYKNPRWKSSGIIIFVCKYYVDVSDTLIGSVLDMFFLLLGAILSELHEKPRRKNRVTEEST